MASPGSGWPRWRWRCLLKCIFSLLTFPNFKQFMQYSMCYSYIDSTQYEQKLPDTFNSIVKVLKSTQVSSGTFPFKYFDTKIADALFKFLLTSFFNSFFVFCFFLRVRWNPLLHSLAVHTQREAEFRAYFLHVERSRRASVRFTCLRLCARKRAGVCRNGLKHGNEIRRNLWTCLGREERNRLAPELRAKSGLLCPAPTSPCEVYMK